MEEEYLRLFWAKRLQARRICRLMSFLMRIRPVTLHFVFRNRRTFARQQCRRPSHFAGNGNRCTGGFPNLQTDESRIRSGTRLYYRQPVITLVRLTDGQKELLQARIPIYQKGPVLNFIIN